MVPFLCARVTTFDTAVYFTSVPWVYGLYSFRAHTPGCDACAGWRTGNDAAFRAAFRDCAHTVAAAVTRNRVLMRCDAAAGSCVCAPRQLRYLAMNRSSLDVLPAVIKRVAMPPLLSLTTLAQQHCWRGCLALCLRAATTFTCCFPLFPDALP